MKWVNSLKAARDGTFQGGIEDPNDASRYEKLKIYSRITGKSMYVEYDTLLETYEEKVHEVIETKLVEQLQRTKRWKQIEEKIGKAIKKEIENRKANKYSMMSQNPNAF
jgi:hypothetical protein